MEPSVQIVGIEHQTSNHWHFWRKKTETEPGSTFQRMQWLAYSTLKRKFKYGTLNFGVHLEKGDIHVSLSWNETLEQK